MRFAKSLSATSAFEMSRATRRRAARSSSFASVMMRSTQRRSSFAFASVVVIRPASSSDVQRFRISALRALVSRLRRRPLFRCRICLAEYRVHLVGLHVSLLDQLLLDLVQRLAAEVPEAQELVLLLSQQLADRGDVVGLEAVEGPHREVELLDRDLVQAVARGLLAAAGRLRELDVVAVGGEGRQARREVRGCAARRLPGRER